MTVRSQGLDPSSQTGQESVEEKAERLRKEGNLAFVARDWPRAEQLYTKALLLNSKSHLLYGNRSAVYSSLEQGEKALLDAEEAIELQPTWSKGYFRKGTALGLLRRYAEAEEAFRKSQELEKTKKSAINKQIQDMRTLRLKADEMREIVSADDWLDVFAARTDMRDRLGSFIYFWNASTKGERLMILQRFLQILGGGNVDKATLNRYTEEDLGELPLTNYETFEMPANWTRYYSNLSPNGKMIIMEDMYLKTNDEEKTLIIRDLRAFLNGTIGHEECDVGDLDKLPKRHR